MSHLSQELDRYLTVRRGLGFDLGSDESVLRAFITFAERNGAEHISTALFLQWQAAPGHASLQTWAQRLGKVRQFAQWLGGLDPAHEIPPKGLIPGRPRRPRPYIYSRMEIEKIVTAASDLSSVQGLRGLTFSTLFGLIAMTGLRIGEALTLDRDDVDLDQGVLTIRRGKLGKARLVPIHASVAAHLHTYAGERDRLLGYPPRSFFATDRRNRPRKATARYNFAQICQRIGLRKTQQHRRHGCGPRIHDLRHSFAARTMIGWYRAGADPTREMLKLATYLGHTTPESTYWYIEAVPELLELAARRAADSSDEETAQ